MATMATTATSLSTEEQQQRVWNELLAHNNYPEETTASPQASEGRQWPTYDHLIADMADADYHHTLTCPYDVVKNQEETCGRSKTISPHGAVCRAKLELFPLPDNYAGSPYTGLLQPGTNSEHCILRLSSAMRPPNLEITSSWARTLLYASGEKLRNAKLFPTAALKVFRQDVQSGNLLFGGSKIGQREADYFAHCQASSMTERMPRLVKPFVKKFWRYSDHPLSLGTSEFCTHRNDGSATETEGDFQTEVNFPFAVILRPCKNRNSTASSTASTTTTTPVSSSNSTTTDAFADSFDAFLDDVLSTPAGTVLFDVFACPDPFAVPDPSKLQRIGRITTTSEMIQSAPDDGLFFRHQKKEEDYDLRPSWREALKAQVSMDAGKVKGTIGQLAGWKLFEEHINKETYENFEM
jgi:hypothetical protein